MGDAGARLVSAIKISHKDGYVIETPSGNSGSDVVLSTAAVAALRCCWLPEIAAGLGGGGVAAGAAQHCSRGGLKMLCC